MNKWTIKDINEYVRIVTIGKPTPTGKRGDFIYLYVRDVCMYYVKKIEYCLAESIIFCFMNELCKKPIQHQFKLPQTIFSPTVPTVKSYS